MCVEQAWLQLPCMSRFLIKHQHVEKRSNAAVYTLPTWLGCCAGQLQP
jgi:hypothetical protein